MPNKGRTSKHTLYFEFSRSDLSSESSSSSSRSLGLNSIRSHERLPPNQENGDYLSRLFERKKLKDKSLSKKLQTPLDRRLNRSCWPIELSKVCKIKKKPKEKKKGKPHYKFPGNGKFLKAPYVTCLRRIRPKTPFDSDSSGEDDDEEDHYKGLKKILSLSHFLKDPIAQEMLMDMSLNSENLN